MNRVIRVTALFLVLSLVASFALIGCGSKETASESSTSAVTPNTQGQKSDATATKDPLAERQQISMAYWGAGSYGNDDWYKDLSEKFNVDISFINLDWSDWVQKLKLMASSGEMPDFIPGPLPSSDYFTMAKQGVLKAVPKDLSAYPALKEFMSAEIFNNFKIDGKIYTVPRTHNRQTSNSIPSYRFIVRKDWMQQCGITQDPQNWEQLFEMCKTFVDKNISGKKQTVGYTSDNVDVLTYPIKFSLGNAIESWELVDGKWMPGVLHQRNAEWINILRKYYKAGAIDKDFAINKNEDGLNKFVSGTAGLYIMAMTTYDYRDKVIKPFEKANPGMKASDSIKLLMFPKNDKGELRIQNDPLIGTGTYFSANTSDEKLDRILRMMDYFLTDEGIKFGQLGKEGRDYTVEGNNIKILREEKYPTQTIASMTYWMVDYSRMDETVSKEIKDEINQAYDILSKESVKDERHFDIDWADTPAKAKWNYNVELIDGIAKIIVGDQPVEAMFKSLADAIIANGGTEAINEVNELMSKK